MPQFFCFCYLRQSPSWSMIHGLSMSESVPFYELTYESTFKGMQKVSEIKEELDLAEDESKRIDILECFKSTFLL